MSICETNRNADYSSAKKKGKNIMVMQEKLVAEIEKRKAKDDLYRDISELEDVEKAELLNIMESVALKFIEDNFNLIAEYSLMTWNNDEDDEDELYEEPLYEEPLYDEGEEV